MKTLLATLVVALGVASAQAAPPAPYVSVVRITPGAELAKVLAFQNTSDDLDVIVHRIEVSNASTQSVTGGLMQFWVYGSTSLTHSASAGKAWTYASVLGSAFDELEVSTAPLLVQYEGDSGILTTAQANNLSGQLPLIKPLVVNNDETATANLSDSWVAESADAKPLTLPHGTDRALVFEKRKVGGTDYTDGQVFIRLYYTVR